jgi:hypothetical protein
MPLTSNKTYVRVNGGVYQDISLSDASHGLGTFTFDGSDSSDDLYQTSCGKRFIALNEVHFTHVDNAGQEASGKTIWVGWNSYKAVSGKFPTVSGTHYWSSIAKVRDILSSFNIAVWPFAKLGDDGDTADIGHLTSTQINSVFNFGNTYKLKLGVEIEYKLVGPSTRYAYLNITPGGWGSSVFLDDGKLTVPTMDDLVDGDKSPTNYEAIAAERYNVLTSPAITLPETLLSTLGIPVIKPGTEGGLLAGDDSIILRPIVYWGTITSYGEPSGGFAYVHDYLTGRVAEFLMDVTAGDNDAKFSVYNTDSAVNQDTYLDDYGQITERDPGVADADRISVTVTQGNNTEIPS